MFFYPGGDLNLNAHSRTHVTHAAMLSSAPGFPGNGLCFFFFSPSH